MGKNIKQVKYRRNKFKAGISIILAGILALGFSGYVYNIFEVNSWLWTLQGEIGGIGIALIIIGFFLAFFNKDVSQVV